MNESTGEKREALRRPGDGGERRGQGDRFERRDAREWGGRIGARLEDLDRAARDAFREAAGPLREADGASALIPALALAAGAFAIGLALALRHR